MEVNIFQVDAFSSEPFGGNPAGVVPNAKRLTDIDMQRIANEMNLSETAFVTQRDDNLFRVRFFTPICEVDLCGHATIATFYTLAQLGYIKSISQGIKKVYMDTRIGRLPIEISYMDHKPYYIVMEQDTPSSRGKVELLEELLITMNLSKSDIGVKGEFAFPEIVSTGLPDIILPIRDKEKLDNLNVDFCNLREVCRKLNVIGVHAFYLPNKNSEVVYTRNFAPLAGIDEEAATGTANGALIYYLRKNGLIEGESITSIQGESLKRPSKIYCYINEEDNMFTVKVGGKANIILEGIIKF